MNKFYTFTSIVFFALSAGAQGENPPNLLRANPSGGDFNTPSTWVQNRLPNDGDSVVIPAGVNVTYGSAIGSIKHYTGLTLHIFGTFTINSSAVVGSRNRLYLNFSSVSASTPAVRLYDSTSRVLAGSDTVQSFLYVCTGVTAWRVNGAPQTGSGLTVEVFGTRTEPDTIVGPARVFQTTTGPDGTYQQGFTTDESTLPVVLGYFDAVKKGGSVVISWSTLQEHNTKMFVIEKSINGSVFYSIGTVAARGNSNLPLSYSYLEASSSATEYYRIRIVDRDGRSYTTGVKAIRGGVGSEFVIYPNPAVGVANLMIDNPGQESFSISVINRSGQRISQERAAASTTFVRLDLCSYAPGDYIIDLQFANGRRQSGKLVILKR